MAIYFVCDGERDELALPELVSRVVGRSFESHCTTWKLIRLNRGHGYHKRLSFALVTARDEGHEGVVAVLDKDKANRNARLQDLKRARDEDRGKNTPLPTALGEASPHFDAWLLDDRNACAQLTNLHPDDIPNIRQCHPKTVLQKLQENSGYESASDFCRALASHVDIGRCHHARETGLEEFRDDVRREFG